MVGQKSQNVVSNIVRRQVNFVKLILELSNAQLRCSRMRVGRKGDHARVVLPEPEIPWPIRIHKHRELTVHIEVGTVTSKSDLSDRAHFRENGAKG
jgi:hypothetical protein